jgi:hypothetical protein
MFRRCDVGFTGTPKQCVRSDTNPPRLRAPRLDVSIGDLCFGTYTM